MNTTAITNTNTIHNKTNIESPLTQRDILVSLKWGCVRYCEVVSVLPPVDRGYSAVTDE